MTEHQVRAGWYPDPLGAPQLRWWDGRAWTTHISTDRQATAQQTAASVGWAEPADTGEPRRARHRAEPAGSTAKPTADDQFATGRAALPSGTSSTPELGWAGAALTLHSVQSQRVPMIIELGVSGHPTIHIDARHQAYEWVLELGRFPAHPVDVVVSVRLVGETTPAPFELPGKSLDELLWKVGRAAFPERLAPWLEDGDGYRLGRWPNWTSLAPDTDHIRQTAMLANMVLTVEQLAALSGRTVATSRTLINALSLMGVLVTIPAADLVARTAPVALPEGSLFQRLRKRFGM